MYEESKPAVCESGVQTDDFFKQKSTNTDKNLMSPDPVEPLKYENELRNTASFEPKIAIEPPHLTHMPVMKSPRVKT